MKCRATIANHHSRAQDANGQAFLGMQLQQQAITIRFAPCVVRALSWQWVRWAFPGNRQILRSKVEPSYGPDMDKALYALLNASLSHGFSALDHVVLTLDGTAATAMREVDNDRSLSNRVTHRSCVANIAGAQPDTRIGKDRRQGMHRSRHNGNAHARLEKSFDDVSSDKSSPTNYDDVAGLGGTGLRDARRSSRNSRHRYRLVADLFANRHQVSAELATRDGRDTFISSRVKSADTVAHANEEGVATTPGPEDGIRVIHRITQALTSDRGSRHHPGRHGVDCLGEPRPAIGEDPIGRDIGDNDAVVAHDGELPKRVLLPD